MPRQIKKEKTIKVVDRRIYTSSELQKFDSLVKKYRTEYDMTNGEKIYPVDMNRLKIAYGAISKDGGVILTGIVYNKYHSIETYGRPTRLEQFENLWEQYQWWKAGEDWKQKMFEKNKEEVELLEEELDHDVSLF